MDNNYGNNNKNLPPLPPSDEKSLAWNRRDNFYGVRARDFWTGNELVSEKIDDFEKCEHYFERQGSSVECKKCHMGLAGYFEIKDGKLFYESEPIAI